MKLALILFAVVLALAMGAGLLVDQFSPSQSCFGHAVAC